MNNNEEAVLQAMLAEIQKNNQLIRGLIQTIGEDKAQINNDLEVKFMTSSIAENEKQKEIRKTARICIGIVGMGVGIAVMLSAWGQLQLMGGF